MYLHTYINECYFMCNYPGKIPGMHIVKKTGPTAGVRFPTRRTGAREPVQQATAGDMF